MISVRCKFVTILITRFPGLGFLPYDCTYKYGSDAVFDLFFCALGSFRYGGNVVEFSLYFFFVTVQYSYSYYFFGYTY